MFIYMLDDEDFVNLEFLIRAERIDRDSGKVRLTIETGIIIDLDGPSGDRLLGQLRALADDPFPKPVTTIVRRGNSAPPEGRTG